MSSSDAAAEASRASESSSESEDGDAQLQVMFEDLLVTNEGEWIEAHRHNLLQLWNLLKQGRSRFNDNYLTGCNFRIFCSFVYRWTEDEDTDEEDSDDAMSEDNDEEQTGQEDEETVD